MANASWIPDGDSVFPVFKVLWGYDSGRPNHGGDLHRFTPCSSFDFLNARHINGGMSFYGAQGGECQWGMVEESRHVTHPLRACLITLLRATLQRLMGGTLAGESSALLSKRSWAAEVCPWYWCLCKFTHWPWLTRLATTQKLGYMYIYIYIYHSLSMQGGRTDSWCRISWTTWDMNMKSWVMQKFCPSTAKSVNRFKKRYEKLHSDHKDG